MDIAQRREEILKKVVEEYIKTALPISSDFLKAEGFWDISPATIRIDLAELTDEGFLEKPYVSGGRIPTDKGYRFFVDQLPTDSKIQPKRFENLLVEFNDVVRLSQEIARILAKNSANLGLVYLKDYNLICQEGWERLIQEPEFNDIDYTRNFIEGLRELTYSLDDLPVNQNQTAQVFIGQECPLDKNNFSVIVGQGIFENNQNQPVYFAITGPKRMNFYDNIRLINDLMNAFN
jgi:transcriptional regulator of heat shock response